MQKINLTARTDARLDVLVSEYAAVSRSLAAKWIADGLCTVMGKVQHKAGFKVNTGMELEVNVPDAAEAAAQKENIPLDIFYQDEDIAIVNKPCGMVVHPAAGNERGTLVNALLFAMDNLSGIGGVKRPGIVHRLDKDTSGLLIVAKNDAAHLSLSKQLSERTMEKHYLAVVEGMMKEPSGLIDSSIARSKRDRKRMAIDPEGRDALTHWALLENLKHSALLDVQILTGRTHQIRIHMLSIHRPIVGDVIYGQKNSVRASRLMLHAHTLSFDHPRTGERLSFTAEPPKEFLDAVEKLR